MINKFGELEKHSYKLIYRDSIIDENIRNVYYSEDGFKLPQSIKNK